jgi:hypothetical protein
VSDVSLGDGSYFVRDGQLTHVVLVPIPYYDISWTLLVDMCQLTPNTWGVQERDGFFVAKSKPEMLAKLKELIPQP